MIFKSVSCHILVFATTIYNTYQYPYGSILYPSCSQTAGYIACIQHVYYNMIRTNQSQQLLLYYLYTHTVALVL